MFLKKMFKILKLSLFLWKQFYFCVIIRKNKFKENFPLNFDKSQYQNDDYILIKKQNSKLPLIQVGVL